MSDRPASQTDIDRVLARVDSLEQKLWGTVAAIFLLVVGFLISQITQASEAAVPSAQTGYVMGVEIARWVVGVIGG